MFLHAGFHALTYAQGLQVTGSVLSDSLPLSGATVSVGHLHTHTAADGRFAISHLQPGRCTLTVSYVGFRTYVRQIDLAQTSLAIGEIVLQRESGTLKEVTLVDSYEARRKREQALNIEVVSGEYIQRNLGGSLMKSLEKLPGIKSIGIGSGNSKPLIRGLGFNQVLVVENGTKHEGQQWGADHGLEIDQYAAGKIEIVKGPASFMYGSDAIAGIIDINAAPIPGKSPFGGTIQVTGKSNNAQAAASAYLFGRAGRWSFSTRLTIADYADFRVPADTVFVYSYAVPLYKHHVRNTAGREQNIHFSAGWENEIIETRFHGSRIYNRAGFFANAHGLEPRSVNAEEHDHSPRDILFPSQEATHHKLLNTTIFKLKQHRLEWQLGYQRNFREEWNRYVNHGYMPPTYPTHLKTPANLERQFNKTVVSAHVKDRWRLHNHEITTGGNAEFQHNRIGGWGFLIPAFSQTQGGLFVHHKVEYDNRLTVLSALRYDYGRIHIREYRDWFPSQTADNYDTSFQYLVRAENTVRTFSSFNWSAGIAYEPGTFSFKVNAGSSFRMPIAKELAANGVNYHYFRYEKGDADLLPERSYQLDLGLAWRTAHFSVLATPFINYFDNYIYLNPTAFHDYYYGAGNQVFEYAQSKVLRYGAEVQMEVTFLRNWTTKIAAEYLYNNQLSGSKKGYTLPFSPPPSSLLSLTYDVPLKKKERAFYAGVEWRITASQNRIVPPERTTAAYQLFAMVAGGKLALKNQPVNISFQIQNLLNTRYLDHTSFYRLIELPEPGRNAVLSITVPLVILKDQLIKNGNNSNTQTAK